ncbi:hypothetical protein ASD25_29010 [Brevundimonas sp. Root1423]|nr:hypothetical protein ASD25_29010 [Brevundimonas sp. Root1423]
MFEALNERLTGVFDRITGRGALSEKDVSEAMREVRVALLEADVALPVVKDFIAFATERATGEDVIRSVKPADQVVKIVYDGLVEMLGGDEPTPINLNARVKAPPGAATAVIWPRPASGWKSLSATSAVSSGTSSASSISSTHRLLRPQWKPDWLRVKSIVLPNSSALTRAPCGWGSKSISRASWPAIVPNVTRRAPALRAAASSTTA